MTEIGMLTFMGALAAYAREWSIQQVVTRVKAKADAALVMHRPEDSADDIVEQMIAVGWTLTETEVVLGKRLRIMIPPKEVV